MIFQRLLFSFLITAVLAGCGGGSDGTREENAYQPPERQPVPANLDDLALVSSFNPPLEKPEYQGSFEYAAITQENGPHFAWALFEMLAAAYSVGRDMDLQKPAPFHWNYEPVNMREMSCQAGTRDDKVLEFSDHTVEIITYNECVTERGTVTGQIVLKSHLNLLRKPDDREAHFRRLTFRRGGEYTMVDGLVELNDHRQYNIMLTLVNSVLDEVYYTDDLFVSGTSPEGKIYHNRWGYVDIESGLVGTSRVRQLGKGYTVQAFRVSDWEDWKLELKLTFDRRNALYSVFAHNQFPDFPHLNRPPLLQWTLVRSRSSTRLTALDFSLSDDPDQDYLSFEWEYVSAPPGCESYSLGSDDSYAEFGVVWVHSSCPGQHRIRASVSDGISVVSKILTLEK